MLKSLEVVPQSTIFFFLLNNPSLLFDDAFFTWYFAFTSKSVAALNSYSICVLQVRVCTVWSGFRRGFWATPWGMVFLKFKLLPHHWVKISTSSVAFFVDVVVASNDW